MAFYILNTNRHYDDYGHNRMLQEQIAAAFCVDPGAPNTRWKYLIETLKKGDYVFLYGNEMGIMACGQITEPLFTEPCDCFDTTDPTGMYYKKLVPFRELKNPIISTQIDLILGRRVVLGRTLIPLDEVDGFNLLGAFTFIY